MKKAMKSKRVAVGLSGGVDSAVTAALLLKQGYDVTGVFLECYQGPGCRTDEDRKDALDVALHLDIPFEVLNFKKEYRERVIEYFYSEYEKGRTPNPDVVCNREIKFGMFYDWAIEEQEFDAVATGHYARIQKIREETSNKKQVTNKSQITNHKFQLMRGVDDKKDQSYFLYQLRGEQLQNILFPLGEMTKDEVREKAKAFGLPVAEKPDSQGICFIGEVSVTSFLQDLGMKQRLGSVVVELGDASDESRIKDHESSNLVEIGVHMGAWFYTVGQRIGVADGQVTGNNKLDTKRKRLYMNNLERAGLEPSRLPPLYVLSKDVEENWLVVGTREEAMRKEFEVGEVHYIQGRDPDDLAFSQAQDDGDLRVRIRHGGQLLRAEVKSQKLKAKSESQNLQVILEEPVFGVAPGQAAVFYESAEALAEGGVGDVVVGGGVIV